MNRGEVYIADLNPTRGSEQAGIRPVLIYEDDRLLPASSTVVVIPFTTNLARQRLPTCLFVPVGEGGLHVDSIALCHQIRAIDKQRLVNLCGSLPVQRMEEIDQTVRRTLGL